MDLPRLIGRYEIRARIAAGATAEVFLARSASGGPDVAIKRLHPHLADDADAVALLLDEARLAARLEHPAAVPVIDLGCDDGSWFVAFEHVPGHDLRAVLARLRDVGERLPVGLATALTVEIASALEALHRLEGDPLVHGDVSPGNVLISCEGAVRLVDLGACVALARGAPGVFGTPGYVAPEQARGDRACPGADVFSAGAILFEMLTGAAPGPRETFAALADAGEHATVPALRAAGVAAALAEAVARALDPDPAARFASAGELLAALAPFADDEASARAAARSLMRRLFPDCGA